MNDIKVCVLGGDLRQLYAAREMYKNNIDISVFGLNCDNSEFNECKTLDEAINNADTILLPLPFSTDGIRVFSPLSDKDIKLDSLIDKLSADQSIAGGKLSKDFLEKLKKKNIEVFDFYNSERLTVMNALPTAEGAVCIAMNELNITLSGSKCAVLGFGRIGKILSKTLKNMGADVTVFARSENALAWAENEGYTPKQLSKMSNCISDKNVIFNTIPSLVVTKDIIEKTDSNSIIIDLASSPGGVDFEYARKLERKVIFALSLPGKYAPATAGKIIADTIILYLKGDKL